MLARADTLGIADSLPLHVTTLIAPSAIGIAGITGTGVASVAGLPDIQEGFDPEAQGEQFYRHQIAVALERSGGVQTKAAELLGMSFRSFRYYAKKFNLR